MARLAATAAILALLFVAAAATFRTTITTVQFDEEANPKSRGSSQQCRQQIQGRQIRQCEQFLTRGSYIVLPKQEGSQAHLQQCCQQLRQMEDECRCEAIRQIVKEQLREGEVKGQQYREVVQKAQNLPSMCGLSPRRCDIHSGDDY